LTLQKLKKSKDDDKHDSDAERLKTQLNIDISALGDQWYRLGGNPGASKSFMDLRSLFTKKVV